MESKEYLIYLYNIASKWYAQNTAPSRSLLRSKKPEASLMDLRDAIYDGNYDIPVDFWYYKFSRELNEDILPFKQWKRDNKIKKILE